MYSAFASWLILLPCPPADEAPALGARVGLSAEGGLTEEEASTWDLHNHPCVVNQTEQAHGYTRCGDGHPATEGVEA